MWQVRQLKSIIKNALVTGSIVCVCKAWKIWFICAGLSKSNTSVVFPDHRTNNVLHQMFHRLMLEGQAETCPQALNIGLLLSVCLWDFFSSVLKATMCNASWESHFEITNISHEWCLNQFNPQIILCLLVVKASSVTLGGRVLTETVKRCEVVCVGRSFITHPVWKGWKATEETSCRERGQ